MTRLSRYFSLSVAAVLGCASPVAAQQGPTLACTDTRLTDRDAAPAEDVVVVTASRHEEQLINAPVTMTVIPAAVVSCTPSSSLPELLRTVPGINVVQTSARDVNIASRATTGTLVDSLLVLLDGRSMYLDFFGFVMWDFLPIDTAEIKQIEVIRGPASAVWGANAMTGVVNVISKTPREMEGTLASARLGSVDLTRPGDSFRSGSLTSASVVHADTVDDRLAYKVSAGYASQAPFLRPQGTVNGTDAPYPEFSNRGTEQYRADARADYDFADGRRKITLAGGLAGTTGILHTGLGPLDIAHDAVMKYGRIEFDRDRLKVQFFVNDLDGDGPFLLQAGLDGQPLQFAIENQAYNVDVSNTRIAGTRHLLTYGGNFRHNSFEISLAPAGHTRDEGGVYVQDQIVLSDRFRLFIGTRVDKFGLVDGPVFSPRTALIIKPRPEQSIRVSFNRAFQAPSFINNYFDTAFLTTVNLGPAGPFRFPSVALGNPDLKAEQLTAYEAGYIVSTSRFTFDAAFYVNQTQNALNFTQTGTYSAANPPPGWPLPPAALDVLAASGKGLPSAFSYRNFDQITTRGIEVALDAGLGAGVTAFANYAWQADPVPTGVDLSELNLPSNHSMNLGARYSGRRVLASASTSLLGEAFWQDVLDARYHGYTEPHALIDAVAGLRSSDGRVTVLVRAANLANSAKLQHVFGDVIRRTLSGELRVAF